METSPNADDVGGVRGRVRGQRVRGDGRGRTEKLFDRVLEFSNRRRDVDFVIHGGADCVAISDFQ